MPLLPLEDEDEPRLAWEWIVGVAVALVCAGWIAYRLHPDLILSNTTPNGGDVGAHVYWPWFLEHHWFTSGRLAGWSPSWYSGFPIGQYYFPTPAILTALLDLVLPYAVAFKIVTAIGPILLPIAAYVFADQNRFPWPAPPAFAVATFYYQFEVRYQAGKTTWTIYGGNLASGLAGEYSFTLALALGLFALGALAYTLRTGRRAWLPAVLLAACVTSHVVVALFVAFAALLVWLIHRPGRTWRIAVPVGVVALFLSLVWTLPLLATNAYTSSMRYGKVTEYGDWLFGFRWWTWVLVGAAVLGAGFWLRKTTAMLLVWAVVFALAFRFGPQDLAIWNTRFIPFYFLAIAFLCAMGVVELARLVAYLVRAAIDGSVATDRDEREAVMSQASPAEDALDTILAPAPVAPWASAPAASVGADDSAIPAPPPPPDWSAPLPPTSARATYGPALARRRAITFGIAVMLAFLVPASGFAYFADNEFHSLSSYWAEWNYSGYESKGVAWNEYRDLMLSMQRLGKDRGCGRTIWEPSAGEPDALNTYGTPLALMLLPYWTNDCIGSQEGLYFESSGTKDAHFMTVSELAQHPSNPVSGLEYGTPSSNFGRGVEHARMLGVRYLMFWTKESQALADAHKDLRLVLDVPDIDHADPKGWKVYEIRDWALVAPLPVEPVVAKTADGTKSRCWSQELVPNGGLDTRLTGWECASDPWWMDDRALEQPIAESGPAAWKRVSMPPGKIETVAGVTAQDKCLGDRTSWVGNRCVTVKGDPLAALRTLTPTALPPVEVTRIHEDDHSIRFHVDRLGTPVVVRTSFFPNWAVHGADGPWRIAPNLMVVIPRSHDVSLTYDVTTAEWGGRLGTLAGLAGLVWLIVWFRPRREWTAARNRPRTRATPDPPGDADGHDEPVDALVATAEVPFADGIGTAGDPESGP